MMQGRLTLDDGRSVDLWVDTAYATEMHVEVVQFAGDRYFELAADAAMAEILAISPEMVIVTGDSAIRITTMAEQAAAYPAPTRQEVEREDNAPGETDALGGESTWDEFMRWLFGR